MGLETTEFRRAFAVETTRLLRNRLLWFVCVWGGLSILTALIVWAMVLARFFGGDSFAVEAFSDWGFREYALLGTTNIVLITGYVTAFIAVLKNKVDDNRVVWVSMALVVIDGLNQVAVRAGDIGLPGGLVFFAVTHFLASALFPWSPGQAIRPAAIVLGVSLTSRLTIEGGPSWDDVLAGVASCLVVAPGVLVCWARHSRRMERFKYTFVDQRYGVLRQELQYARAIHEALFPQPKTKGSVRLAYRYEPMRQIGGDYLHATVCPTDDGRDEKLNLVLMDVTGHGIPAALSVNRLHGEMELCFADDPDCDPGEVLRRLNRYVQLTLAKHSIFVTAMVVRVDPLAGTIEHASAGHPPAFLRGSDGTIRELESTAIVLGALPDKEFDPDPRTNTFGPGDSVVLYTDGATEARNDRGDMVRIDGLRRLMADPTPIEPGTWPERVLDVVLRHRGGLPAEDDTLVVEVYRSVDRERVAKGEVDAGNGAAVEECETVLEVGARNG
ncbi:MAG: PP2C family protein-serine/threonine phosphatase [Planctomycetota bacterium]